MTKRLEELLNLESKNPTAMAEIDAPKPRHEQITTVEQSLKEVEDISRNLPKIQELNDLEEADLDDLAKKAETAYDDLMDLGMNVEVRYSGRIFEVASSMLKNAIDAKSAKIDKKLKAIDLQLKKYKIDQDTLDSDDNLLDGKGYIITDRNDLLKKLSQKD
jgi:hypothetical protein